MSIIERLWAKIQPEPNSGCWLWTGAYGERGYGRIWNNGKMHAAHRVSYELYKAAVSSDLVIDHLCRTPSCVNPDHLDLVTQKENARRGSHHHREKTHCIHGHPFSPENSYWYKSRRVCRMCEKIRTERRRQDRQAYRKEGRDDG